VLDQADGPANSRSALAWHTTGSSPLQENRIVLREGANPAALVLLPIESGIISAEPREESGESGLRIEFQPQQEGSLRLATVFLTGKWSDAAVQLAVQDGKQAVQITLAGEEILIPLEMNADDE
jgi:hypothetical protein